MIITVKRKPGPEGPDYIQRFSYEGSGKETVAHILEELNSREELVDITGSPADMISWECSCMQQMCGSCAMVINGRPALACSEFIDLDKEKELSLAPMTKFPVIRDLEVDRSCIQEHQKQALMYLGERAVLNEKEHEQQYMAAKCLKCGLCLEVCPNYKNAEGKFYGAVLAQEAYLLHSSTENRKRDISKQYRLHFGRGCSKSMACRDICPAKIPTLSSIGYMNRK